MAGNIPSKWYPLKQRPTFADKLQNQAKRSSITDSGQM